MHATFLCNVHSPCLSRGDVRRSRKAAKGIQLDGVRKHIRTDRVRLVPFALKNEDSSDTLLLSL
jgi:hypothetical protein